MYLTGLLMTHSVAASELQTVTGFALEPFLGRWFQIALLPNRYQARCASGTMAHYSRKGVDRIRVVNECLDTEGASVRAEGAARINATYRDPARLQIRFAPRWLSRFDAVWGDYWVIAIDHDYTHALIGTPDREYLWVLARQPRLGTAPYAALLEIARSRGFAVENVKLEAPEAVAD